MKGNEIFSTELKDTLTKKTTREINDIKYDIKQTVQLMSTDTQALQADMREIIKEVCKMADIIATKYDKTDAVAEILTGVTDHLKKKK